MRFFREYRPEYERLKAEKVKRWNVLMFFDQF